MDGSSGATPKQHLLCKHVKYNKDIRKETQKNNNHVRPFDDEVSPWLSATYFFCVRVVSSLLILQ